jgi:transposase-like protein
MSKAWLEGAARRSFWSIHIKAWRESGVGQHAYCRDHGLSRNTFRRWLKALEVAAAQRSERKKQRRKAGIPVSHRRTKAVMAFWAMHVEALNWSGLRASEYAQAHGLPVDSLRRWRQELDRNPPDKDWREMLHPSARPWPKTGVELSTRTKFSPPESRLTEAPKAPPGRDGRSNRRTFTEQEKLRLVAETQQPGASVSAVARRHQIATSVLFRWRAELGLAQSKSAEFATVATIRVQERRRRGRPRKEAATLALQGLLPCPEGSIVVELGDGRHVFAPAGSDPEAVRRYVAERETGP